jgi:hypothetical protein
MQKIGSTLLVLVVAVAAVYAWSVAPLPDDPHVTKPSKRQDIRARWLLSYVQDRPTALELPEGAIAVDLHVHTKYSHDSAAEVEDVVLAAADRGLAGIAITDHQSLDGVGPAREALERFQAEGRIPPEFFIISGQEVSTAEGHIIALYIDEVIPAQLTARETIQRIRAQGGLAVAAHPMFKNSLGEMALELPVDAVEVVNHSEELLALVSGPDHRRERRAFYPRVEEPGLAVSDAHEARLVGIVYTLLPDTEPTPAAVRAAIEQGNTVPSGPSRFSERIRFGLQMIGRG